LKKLSAIVCLGLFVWEAGAQVDLPEAFRNSLKRAAAGPRSSLSGQFVIYEPSDTFLRLVPLDGAARSNYVRVEASLLAVTCERVKKALLAELQAPDQWRGKISFSLHRARSLDEMVVISASQNGTDWGYYVDMPDTLEPSRLVASVVNALLLETANRNSERSAEIPTWLVEGLARQLVLSSAVPLVLDQPAPGRPGISASFVQSDGVRRDPLATANEELRAHLPLTLEELTWPADGQLTGEAGESYRSSAQLFVHELTQLDQGRACLRTMVGELARHLNWQMAFLDAFKSHFSTQLELEKWWDLRLVTFTGRDLTQTWPAAESWDKLDEIIRPAVEVRMAINELPLRTQVNLQTIIREWDFAQQAGVLNQRIQQLFVLRTRVSQDLVSLVDDYRQVLDAYMKQRAKSSTGRRAVLGLDSIARETIAQLDTLDARREQLRPAAQSLQSADANIVLTH
jgi:hypothetical protein